MLILIKKKKGAKSLRFGLVSLVGKFESSCNVKIFGSVF